MAEMEKPVVHSFAQDYVVDEIGFQRPKIAGVIAHELAHHRFMGCIPKIGNTSLASGRFATYGLPAEREVLETISTICCNSLQIRECLPKTPIAMNERRVLYFFTKRRLVCMLPGKQLSKKAFKR
jgi:hypothetical protein